MEERFLNLTTAAIEAGKASSSASGHARPEDCERGGDEEGMGGGFEGEEGEGEEGEGEEGEGEEGEGDAKRKSLTRAMPVRPGSGFSRIVNNQPRIEMFNLKVLRVLRESMSVCV